MCIKLLCNKYCPVKYSTKLIFLCVEKEWKQAGAGVVPSSGFAMGWSLDEV